MLLRQDKSSGANFLFATCLFAAPLLSFKHPDSVFLCPPRPPSDPYGASTP